MNTKKNTQPVIIQYIIGDNNKSDLYSNLMSPSLNIDIDKLIEENQKLRSDLRWAMEQLRIKDLLLKKLT